MVDLTRGMQLALKQAHLAYQCDQVPVGAALISGGGHVLALSHNDRSRMFGHAEVLALLQCQGPYAPEDSTLFVTLEPCAMCAASIVNARLPRLVFGAYDLKGGAVDHGARLLESSAVHVVGGVEERACAQLLYDFFNTRR